MAPEPVDDMDRRCLSKPEAIPDTGNPHSRRFASSWASVLLDLLRGVAAQLVLLEHWRNIFFVDYSQIAGRRLLWAPLYLLSGAGHQAVIVFFLLSGFFIGGSIDRSMRKGTWSWNGYLLPRLVRLWIVLLPALLACLFWDKLGMHLGMAPGLYRGLSGNHILPDNISRLLSPRIFVGNLFFLQGLYVHTYGSDGALWSLCNEFWYYILFPLGLLTIYPSTKLTRRVTCACLFLAVAWFTRGGVLSEFPIWLAGVALLRTPHLPVSASGARLARIVAPLLYSAAFFYLAKSRTLSGIQNDYVLACATFFFLWILLSATDAHPHHSARVRTSRELARFSYTLYALHLPLLIFLGSLLLRDTRWQPTLPQLGVAIAVLITVVGYSFAVGWLAEFRTDTAYLRLATTLKIRRTAPVLPSNPDAVGP